MLVESSYWSTVLSFLAQQYFTDLHATCILWHASFDIQLKTSPALAVVILEPEKWLSLDRDYNYERKRAELEESQVFYNDWILRLTLAIEQSHCESFIVFQEQIPIFARYFYNASIYSIWRSTRNHFIFVYTDELLKESVDAVSYFNGYIFHDQPNILLVNGPFLNSTIFEIKTNSFVGPRYFGKEPMSVAFDTLQQYDAQVGRLIGKSDIDIFSKMQDLQGREIVVAIFNYKPFMLLDYDKEPKAHDRALNGTEVLIDGTEVRLLLIFCELYNCTVQVDTTNPKLMVDDIYFLYTAAYVPRLWAHLDAHSRFVLAWHSSGFDKYWEWKIAAEYMNANRQNRMLASQMPKLDIGPVKLGIDNFIGLILLWCFGMTCSLLAFVAELWCFKVERL